MHAVFYAVGIRSEVDKWLQWVETRWTLLPFDNPELNPEGPKDEKGNLLRSGFLPVNVGIRYGLGGTFEAIFPENDKDKALTLLRFNQPYEGKGTLSKIKLGIEHAVIRKAFGLEEIPKFEIDTSLKMPEDIGKHVRIIPLGVRYDDFMVFPNGLAHEAL